MITPTFEVYKRPYINQEGNQVHYQFIVLVDQYGIKHFTDFGKYVKSSKSAVIKIDDDGNNRFSFVRMFLEYVFFTEHINKLANLKLEHIKNFFKLYHCCELPFDGDNTTRSTQTMSRCRDVIMDFVENLIDAKKISIKKDDLYKTKNVKNRYGRMSKVRIPLFDIPAVKQVKGKIYRDIPNDAFDIMFSHIRLHHPELFGLVMLQSFAGLRPSEACNVRRHDSPLGSGVRFAMDRSDKPREIVIDLTKERKLRSDNAYIGKIKKERTQTVPELFKDAFYEAYNEHLKYTDNRKRETEYGAFNVNRQGKCYTYKSYQAQFAKIVEEELIPIYLKSDNPAVVMYGRTLIDSTISPHAFRHWYTVQLVLNGMDNPALLMEARGDTSPESALTYIRRKSELEKLYKKVNNEVFDYLLWAAEKKATE